jgi:hypothetical protein
MAEGTGLSQDKNFYHKVVAAGQSYGFSIGKEG